MYEMFIVFRHDIYRVFYNSTNKDPICGFKSSLKWINKTK